MVFRVRFMEIRWTRKPHYISDTWCLTSATPECNVRSETSVTVPSRLNAPIVLWRLNNLTLPARVGLKLSTWRLESVAGLQSTRLAKAVYCPLRWRFRTFEIGILAMWMMENVHYLSGHLFLAELSHVANVTEFIATESEAGQERFANVLFSSLFCHLGEKLSLKKRY